MMRTDLTKLRHGSDLLKRGFARMQQGGEWVRGEAVKGESE